MPPKTDLKTSTPTIMVSRSETNANNTVTNTPNQDGKGSKKLTVKKAKTFVEYADNLANMADTAKSITISIPKHSKLVIDKGYETITKKHNSNTTNPTRVLDDANHAMLSAPKKIDKDLSEGLNAFAATVGVGSVVWNAYCLCEARKEGKDLKAVLKEVEHQVKELATSDDPKDIETAKVLKAAITYIKESEHKAMFEQAGAALSILATVMVVAGKFTKDVAPHVLSVGIFLACFKALMNMGHSIKEVFELTETLLASNKIDKIETEKAQEKGEGINLQGKQARMIQQQNIKQNIGYESANVASWAMDAVGTAILGISSLSSLGVSTALSGGLATPIVAPICIVLSAIISITAENKAHKHSGNVEDIKELLELNPEMTKEDVEQKLISLKNQKHVTKEILEHIKENVPVSSSVKYHAGHYALNATSLLTLQLLHTPIKNLQIKNKHNYAQSFKLDEQQLIDTLVKTEFAKGTVLEPVTRNTSSDKAELIQFLELLSKSSNAGYIMTMLARDITHKERRLNPFNKKEKQIDIKDKFADTHLNHEGMKELRREQSLKDQYNIANGVIKDLAEKVGLDGESPDHAKILRALHEKTALFYRFSSKTELRHGTDILSGILSGMQEAELEEYKEEKKKEKAELKASKKPEVETEKTGEGEETKLDNKDKPKETETKQATSTPDVKEIKEMKETKEFVGIPKPEINASVSDFSDMKKQFGLGELGETVKA